MILIAGCSDADDRQTVDLIEKHLSQRSIHYENDKTRDGRIVSLSLPDRRAVLEILPHLSKLEQLETLTIAAKTLQDDDLKTMPRLPQLRYFGTGFNLLSDNGLRHLTSMTGLKRLNLHATQVRGSGIAHLSGLSQLEWLELSSTPLDDSGIPHIVTNFPRLKRLSLANTNITAEGLMRLADLHWLEMLGPPARIVGPDPQTGGSKQERRMLEKMRDRAWLELSINFHDAHVASKQKARAAGMDVPPDHLSPFGIARSMLHSHDRIYDEKGQRRTPIE